MFDSSPGHAVTCRLTQCYRDEYQEEIRKPVFKLLRHTSDNNSLSWGKTDLVVAHNTRNNRSTQTGGYTDTESTYHATDEKVPNHILASVPWE
jgi:hypothetical protein